MGGEPPFSPEKRYAKVREGVIALLESNGQSLLEGGFLDDGRSSGAEPGQGAPALDHLRDVLHDIAEQHGVGGVYCGFCDGLLTYSEHSIEEIEEEAHHACSSERDR